MSALYIILLIGIVLVSLFLLLLVLMQRPKQQGLGATFGVDATNQMFGSRTTDVLQKATTYLTVAFFLMALGLGLLNAHETKKAARMGADLAALPKLETPAPLPVPAEEVSPAVPTTPPAPVETPAAPSTPAIEAPAVQTNETPATTPATPAVEPAVPETPAAAETPAATEPLVPETPAKEN